MTSRQLQSALSATAGPRRAAFGGKSPRIRVLGACMAALFALAAYRPAGASPPMWTVHGAHATVTLFGSIHLLAGAPAWTYPAFDAALAQADSVWLEIPFDAASEKMAADTAQARGVLPAGQSLFALLPGPDRARLLKLGRSVGLTQAALDRMRPWYAETLLSVLEVEAAGGRASQGVEETVQARSPKGARRGALETVEGQIALFADAPLAVQIAALKSTLKDLDADPGAFRRLQSAWLAGDLGAIDREAVRPLRIGERFAYRRLVFDRNARWTRQILKLLQGGGRSFIVVGVGHLVGPDSVVRMLRARGIRVEGP